MPLKKHPTINFTPPLEVAEAATKGLMLRAKFKRGGTMVGVARARDLKNRRTLSPTTIKRMVSFFARHEVDKRSSNWGLDDKPSKGYIAWLLWGGDDAWAWALDIKRKMEKFKLLQLSVYKYHQKWYFILFPYQKIISRR